MDIWKLISLLHIRAGMDHCQHQDLPATALTIAMVCQMSRRLGLPMSTSPEKLIFTGMEQRSWQI